MIMTIKDVAQYSGVSISTVSRVLNHHPGVRESVRRKVMDAIEALHYVPNNSARDLVKTQSDAIGVVMRGAENPFLASVLCFIEQAIEKAGYTMVLQQIGTEDDEVAAGASMACSKRLQGLILLGGSFDYTPERMATIDIPFVCCSFTGSFGSLEKDQYSSVSIDDYAEAYRAVKILTDRGHRKIAILLGTVNDRSINELRYMGYRDALKEAGIDFDEELVEQAGGFGMSQVYEAAGRLIARRNDFTALFTISDSMAIAAMKALDHVGRRVPDDCSVIAIDGIEMSQYIIPTLSTLVQPADAMGKEAVRILVDVLEKKGKHAHLRLETVLREGETVKTVD
jgi:LacI family transcriptional regulator